MKNNITENTPFMTPDGLRKALQMSHDFYDSHTKKNYGYTDINGSRYSGIVENHATELLLESRKLMMEKPSLKNFIIKSSFDFYFDIQYSSLIQTYDQQNTLIAMLKKDVLLPNKEYRIIFSECNEKIILRSESWSDPTVKRDKFYHTTTPPTLLIHDTIDETVEDISIPLIVDDGSNEPINYYFFDNITTNQFIDSYENNILTLKPLTNAMYDLPFIWFELNVFRLLPTIDLVDNIDMNGNTLLTIGTDGHNVSRLYPLVYGKDNIPSRGISGYEWIMKVYPSNGESFYKSANNENNFSVAIYKIGFIQISPRLVIEHSIDIVGDFTEVVLNKDDNIHWEFKSPVEGDFDYDGETYINPVYGYVKLNDFIQNINNDKDLLSAFIIKFSNKFLNKYEYIDGDASSGIHIDTSSEYSNNGIDKKNGIIHGLGDFDGLPRYFKSLADRTAHRPHVELYSIRDRLNEVNQKSKNKQTSAIIVDTAMPRKEIEEVLLNLQPIIKYKKPVIPPMFDDINAGIYYSDDNVKVESELNKSSDIVYVDGNTFGNINIPKYKLSPRFIYHGNRIFSIDMITLDPELEKARVFIISNDESSYTNNELSNYKKPSRTIARICDIPTSFVNLINIINVSPTLILDEFYIRMSADYTTYDKNMLYNKIPSDIVKIISPDKTFIFPSLTNLNDILSATSSTMINDHSIYTNLNASIDLLKTDHEFNVISGGIYFEVGDTFSAILGGVCFKGVVTAVDGSIVTDIEIINLNENNSVINVGNLSNYYTRLKTTTTSGNGVGLLVELSLSYELWESLQVKRNGINDNVIAFKYDDIGNIWINKFINNTWKSVVQFTGDKVIDNIYDNRSTYISRKLPNVILKNMITTPRTSIVNNYTPINPSPTIISAIQSDIPATYNLSDPTDLSSHLIGLNKQNTIYVFRPSEHISSDNHFIEEYSYGDDNNGIYNILPSSNELTLSNYNNISNIISIYDYNIDGVYTQPSAYIFSPLKNTIDEYQFISKDICKNISCLDMNLMTLIYKNGLDTNENNDESIDYNKYIINPVTGKLTTNLYFYNQFDISDERKTLIDYLSTLSREDIINYIINNYGSDAYPLSYETSDLAFDINELINYIMMNFQESPKYIHNNIKLFRSVSENVVKRVDDKYIGVGKQPTGGCVSITSETYDSSLYVNGKNVTSEYAFIFRVYDFPENEVLTNDFIIKDELGIDISNKSILIINNVSYVKTEKGSWVPII